ncbi:hypothetical protein [Mesorhizobium sp.]|uniref:hypothetical protein n=1 Tax=Mesorhizobium sp. TaxID=1871066 RepID=UPI0011F80E54|nr:hypothetical protein [Mesorhizobium sp.]TIQ79724.1 MAG: hypothetical protein E5X39_13505 [Mesorhizobium sp.]
MSDKRSGALAATFDVVDDLLWQAEAGRLPSRGALTLGRSGQIGPLVELALAAHTAPTAYASIAVTPPFFNQVLRGFSAGRVSGGGARDIAGVFPLARLDPAGDDGPWEQWMSHAENAALASGLARGLVSGLLGALGELQENVYQHSGRPETGLVAYAAVNGMFEFVVADAGVGVLTSLRQNPEFAQIGDSGEALRVAVSDGASRHGRASGRGYGIGQVFRALAHDWAELRFRSGDHALRLWGDAPSLSGHFEVAQKARLDGLIITVTCAPGRGDQT